MKLRKLSSSPFYSIQVGATISSSNGKFGPSLINSPVTKFVADTQQTTSMKGESSYVYADQVNQGSFSVVGGYGISGVAKVDAGVSAYAGHSQQSNRKEVSLTYSLQINSGIEYINFDDLSVMDLVNSLANGPKGQLLNALNYFTEIQKQLKEKRVDLLEVIAGKIDDPALKELLNKWLSASHTFFNSYGDGIVAGVIWGGVGEVDLKLTAEQKEENWRYGGSAKFSYAGVGKSISVAAAYDGSNTNRNANIDFRVESLAVGGVVLQQVQTWANTLNEAGLNQLWNVSVLDKAPALSGPPDEPVIPPFQQPPSDPKVTDLFDKIGSLEELGAYAKASAFEAAKAKDPNLTLDKFLEEENQPAKTEALANIKTDVLNNELPEPEENTLNRALDDITDVENSVLNTQVGTSGNLSVLGMWIVNWSELFPWLVRGFDNDITPDLRLHEVLQKQMVLQDLIALERIYSLLDNSGINAEALEMPKFDDLVIEYARSVHYIQDNFEKDTVVTEALQQLGQPAKAILDIWQENYFLRSCELGLGILVDNEFSVERKIKKATNLDQTDVQLIYDKIALSISGPNDYYRFRDTLMGIPLITPGGKVYLVGQNNMALTNVNKETGEFTFSRNASQFLHFTIEKNEQRLVSSEKDIVLLPIKFEVAKNIDNWYGRVISNNLASNKSLLDKFNVLEEEMKGLPKYSYSSDFFKGIPNWNPETSYSTRVLPVQYLGITNRIGNIFR
ncbi:hypothetical protein [Sphingobacterium arenae]|uniref:Uncharacterized protein n=1 Tax=Sphingobacterium arenae TaxID=1280598 RepID=A0ABR7Y2V4_9SPHI|nr:hypothetical protein [Sphingobacterium arenae]MBD1425629.1 hypothetical protein [Sphingobacterium arenae]